ncbi:ribonuclease E/G [Amphibacillus indicireducens]|uniref:Ribonuclease G n=1 Tax=Amphibacillus indicireducens TaxID=1076330 RepID=A0ABP7VCS9_9BACI
MVELILLTRATEKIGVVKQGDQIIELAFDRPDQKQQVESIFLGKVVTVDQSLQAAFIDIGQAQLAYLEKKEIPEFRKDQTKSIETLLYEGQSVIVQITKDAYQDKGARLTMNLTIANHTLVYLPYGNYLAVSKKIDQETAQLFKQNLAPVCEDDEGLIVRTSAASYSFDQLADQVDQLRKIWQALFKRAEKSEAPVLLHQDQIVTDRLIRRFPFGQLKQIYVDQVAVANQIKSRYPELEAIVSWAKEIEQLLPVPIDELIQSVIQPEVSCDSGVTLMIDHTEAMTVIDVNSSGFTGKMNQHNFAYKVNQIALREIAKQIRLRNLSGMIVVDFLRMKDRKHKTAIVKQFEQAVHADPTRTQIYGFTDLGLFELTRKRESAAHYLSLAAKPIQTRPLSLESKVYALERELIATRDEAVVVEVTSHFRQTWDQWIDADIFNQLVQTEVNFLETKGVSGYHIKRSGSIELIAEFLAENNKLKVDKLN